jgi:hypothetical protein
MLTRTRFWLSFTAVLLVTVLGACGDDDDGDDGQVDDKTKPVAGTFVGRVPKTEAFVSVVAAPPAQGQDKRAVTVLVCDAKSLCEGYSGAATGNDFVASGDGDEKAKGKLSEKSAAGSIELPNGEMVRYEAGPATATAGVYELSVSSSGKLSGASATGVGLSGKSPVPDSGTGTLELADGKRLKFEVITSRASDRLPLRPGEVRLIVLPDYQLRGAGKSRRTSRGSDPDFFIRSTSG